MLFSLLFEEFLFQQLTGLEYAPGGAGPHIIHRSADPHLSNGPEDGSSDFSFPEREQEKIERKPSCQA